MIKGVSSKGYERFKVVENTGDCQGPDGQMKICRELLENRFFRITLNPDGTFSGLFDKKSGREVLKPGENGNVLQAFEDKPRYEDNWNLDIYYSEKMWEINGCKSIEAIEAGPVRGIVRVTKKSSRWK